MYTDGKIQVITFYEFIPFTEAQQVEVETAIQALKPEFDLMGLVILGSEGLNTTLSVKREQADDLKLRIKDILKKDDIFFKDSFAPRHPFKDLKVKHRDEIVTLGRTDIVPKKKDHNHLSPDEWNQLLKEEDVLVIDTRNDYEYEIGHFKNALNPDIKEFTEFPKYIKESNIPKDKKIAIYCTGGIRCEKAIYDMNEQGYNNVYQLDGGILNYIKEHPNDQWDGECFVFDFRVAVDQDLKPTEKFRLCPHCGDPGRIRIECIQCGTNAIVCEKCLGKEKHNETCSKNCAHHYQMGHKSKRIHKDGLRGWQGQ